MLNKMIHWALASRALVIGTALILMVMGLKTATELPVEVLPDLTKPTVIILTEAPGLAPEEVETRVTQPSKVPSWAWRAHPPALELRCGPLARLCRVRLGHRHLQGAGAGAGAPAGVREQLPEGVQPFMTPVASSWARSCSSACAPRSRKASPATCRPREVRTLADWTIKRRLQSISGIAEILNMGGGVKQIEVQPDPYKMQAHGVSL
jgi:Cu/Ag efflux pump CusA